MNANEHARQQARTTQPLTPQDFAFLDYLIARAIEAGVAQHGREPPRLTNKGP